MSIANHYPTESILTIPGVWKRKQHNIRGTSMTLDEIEHTILRKQFKEPRIHMDLVCASVGCPPLRRKAHTGAQLSTQLSDQSQSFLALQPNLKIDTNRNIVYLSAIFKWYGDDFMTDEPIVEPYTGSRSQRAVLSLVATYVPLEQ